MRYIGSKASTVEFIYHIITKRVPTGTFCDPFGGIGTIGSYFKKKNYSVWCGDILTFAHYFQIARVQVNKLPKFIKLCREMNLKTSSEIINILNKKPVHHGWFIQEYSEKRNFFTKENAAKIQGCYHHLPNKIIELRNKLSHPAIRYWKNSRTNNIGMTIATGRTLLGVDTIIKELSLLKDMPVILYNGSVVVRNHDYKVISQKTISSQTLKKIVAFSSKYLIRTYAYFYHDPTFNLFTMDKVHEFVLGWSKMEYPKLEFNKMRVLWQKAYKFENNLTPSAILLDISAEQSNASQIESKLKNFDDISITRSGFTYIEIRPKGSNKASALASVSKYLGLSQDEILAIGDNDNDSEMLAWAGIGVAISNASQKALENSDYICHYGVVEGAIELLRIVNKAKHYFTDY